MKNLNDIKNAAKDQKDQIIDTKTLQAVKGGTSDPPPFGIYW